MKFLARFEPTIAKKKNLVIIAKLLFATTTFDYVFFFIFKLINETLQQNHGRHHNSFCNTLAKFDRVLDIFTLKLCPLHMTRIVLVQGMKAKVFTWTRKKWVRRFLNKPPTWVHHKEWMMGGHETLNIYLIKFGVKCYFWT